MSIGTSSVGQEATVKELSFWRKFLNLVAMVAIFGIIMELLEHFLNWPFPIFGKDRLVGEIHVAQFFLACYLFRLLGIMAEKGSGL